MAAERNPETPQNQTSSAQPTGRGRQLAPQGCFLLVEPAASDRLEDNVDPIGKAQSARSATIAVPVALAQQGPYAPGMNAGEQAITEIVIKAGFSRFAKISQTAFLAVYEARP